jgi:hypothetical protein
MLQDFTDQRNLRDLENPVSNVIVTGDLFRVSGSVAGGWIWHQQRNVLWLSRIITGGLASQPDIRTHVLDHKSLGLDTENFGPEHGQDHNLWWASQLATDIDGDLQERLAAAVTGQIVVGFELPTNLASLFEKYASALVRVEISPLRFMNDVLIRAWSNDMLIAKAIAMSAVSEREVYWAAGVLWGKMHNTSLAIQWGLGHVCLLIAQTEYDRSVIENNGFLNFGYYVDKIRDMAAEYDLLIFSPHPIEDDLSVNLKYLLDVPGVRVSLERPYRLLQTGIVDRIASISSSLLSEARYFNVEATRLGPDEEDVPFTNVRIQAFGEGVAEAIADCLGRPLPPLARGTLPPEPIVRQTLVGDWSLRGLEQTGHPLPCLTIDNGGAWYTPENDDFASALIYGWHQLEEWGVWSKSIGVLGLDWPNQREETVTCILELRSLAANTPTQTINVWSDGIKISSFAVPNGAVVNAAFTVPPCRRPGPVQIWLECIHSFRPSTVQPGHADTRLMGIGLSGVKIF